MQSSAAGDAGPFLWERVRCLVVFEVFGSGIFFVAIFGVVGGGGVCVGDGGSIRQHEHFYEIGPL